MNPTTAKKLMIAESQVFYNGVEYDKIKSLIFKKTENGIKACAELLDKNKNSLTTAFLKDIKIDETEDKERINIDDLYFSGLQSEFKRNALLCINSLGISNYKLALTEIRAIISVITDLEEALEQKVGSKEEEEKEK
ncbi:hypothetical protein [Parvimonas micra]|uniref:Uncharacterized protein n=1 Tax=Parvimonas micra ATCC 33270 TaxID=411465 RepID=A8SKM3_9FIRM|nr:hypothetical protein [Parvimonas micra]EDP24142.1 hypothetical protein PEPMIC_00722 [Parvimonas micra ATCC 33270]RSB90406.1 hypothetical protein EGS00_01145 [Parvimonas micra]VEH96872.1 Uncharacterised protein [Parvimonas micra]